MPIELFAILIGSIVLLWLLHITQRKTSGINRDYYRKKWQEVKILGHSSAAASRLAIIEADKLLDHLLKDLRIRGDTMGDRLKNADKLLGNQNAVWSAHKLRNRIAHDDTHPRPREIRQALSAFESCLKKLGAL